MSGQSPEERADRQLLKQKTAMPLLWIAMVSMTMLFAALTSAVIVSKSSREWQSIELPFTFLLSTLAIMLSSLTYWYGCRMARRNRMDALKQAVLITLILGLIFAVLQVYSWSELKNSGIFFTGPSSNVAGSFLYVITGLHLAHLTGGIISLAVVYIKSVRHRYNPDNLLGLQVSSTYWHFLDGLWVYLYIFLNFIAV